MKKQIFSMHEPLFKFETIPLLSIPVMIIKQCRFKFEFSLQNQANIVHYALKCSTETSITFDPAILIYSIKVHKV